MTVAPPQTEVRPVTEIPGLLGPDERALEVQVRRFHACALVEPAGGAPREVRCWGGKNVTSPGDPAVGDTFLGGETGEAITRPTFAGREPVALGLGNEHSCALLDDGSTWCWGSDFTGRLGTMDSEAPRREPQPIDGNAVGKLLSVAGSTGLLHTDGGEVWSWGVADATGRANPDGGEAPTRIPELDGADVEPVAGGAAGCALLGGQVLCWGWNGGLVPSVPAAAGDERGVVDRPTLVELDRPVRLLGVGQWSACASDGGEILCWGSNERGQIDATRVDLTPLPPQVVPGLP